MKIMCQTGASIEVKTDSLENFCFDEMNLHRAIFEGLSIHGATFRKADLRGAIFTNVEGTGVNMAEVRAMNAYFVIREIVRFIFCQREPYRGPVR